MLKQMKKIFTRNVLDNDVRLLKYRNISSFFITNGQWITYKNDSNEEKTIPSLSKNFIGSPENGCETLFNNITVSPERNLLSCCGFFAPKCQFLQFGKLDEGDIAELYKCQFDDLLKIWLYTSGPHKIAQFINKHKDGAIDSSNKHACLICEEIYSNPQNISIIKKYCHDVIPQIIFDYECEQKLGMKKQQKSMM